MIRSLTMLLILLQALLMPLHAAEHAFAEHDEHGIEANCLVCQHLQADDGLPPAVGNQSCNSPAIDSKQDHGYAVFTSRSTACPAIRAPPR